VRACRRLATGPSSPARESRSLVVERMRLVRDLRRLVDEPNPLARQPALPIGEWSCLANQSGGRGGA
jgi:hypothetical protein